MEPSKHVQTKSAIERLLRDAGLRPRTSLGQHFLIDGNLMRRIVDAAEIAPSDWVIEVGCGTGGLTDLLTQRAARVIGVEIDRHLAALLRDRFVDANNFTLIEGDALNGKHKLHGALIEALHDARAGGVRVALVANLPYHVATPLVMNLLLDYPVVRRLTFTVQAEVGDRLSASPGGKTYGPLSIVAQTAASVGLVARLGPQVFWPRPAVDSVMMRLDVIENPLGEPDALRRLASFTHGVFDHRRKTLRSALGYVVDDAVRDAICREFDGGQRPERFSKEEWRRMVEMAKESSQDIRLG